MKLIENLSELKKMTPVPSAAALGTFDGVHLGHQEVIAATGRYAKAYGLKLMVFTFSTHPMASLMPESAQPLFGAIAYIAICWGFLYFLYRQRIFLKV